MPYRVAVVGAGTAGPAIAIMLHEAGHDVTLFEQADRIEAVGAGVLLQPAGQAVLAQMGLLESLRAVSSEVTSLLGTTYGNRKVVDLQYERLRPGLHGLGVYRASLLKVLLDRMQSAGVALRLGAHVQGARRDGDKWHLQFDSGEEGPFDLLVLSDGSRSKLRAATGLEKRADEYPWGALFAIVDDKEHVFPSCLRQWYNGTQKFFGFLPTGHDGEGNQRVSIYWSVRNDQAADLLRQPLSAILDEMRTIAPQCAPVLEEVTDWDQLVHARYTDVVLRSPCGPGVVCIGDAAHAMSPQLGQGVTLALLDAASLSASLNAPGSLQDSLAAYAQSRRSATRFYQYMNRIATWYFQHDFVPNGWVRDALFGPLHLLPPFRRQMLLTLAGEKTGWLSSSPTALPALPP